LNQLSPERRALIKDMWFAIQMSVDETGKIVVKHITMEEFFKSPEEIENES
jgi:hypothetical protein